MYTFSSYERYTQGHRDATTDNIKKAQRLARTLGPEVAVLGLSVHQSDSKAVEGNRNLDACRIHSEIGDPIVVLLLEAWGTPGNFPGDQKA